MIKEKCYRCKAEEKFGICQNYGCECDEEVIEVRRQKVWEKKKKKMVDEKKDKK